ncbi:hypothetical protein D3C78_497670 [compost metagenome]
MGQEHVEIAPRQLHGGLLGFAVEHGAAEVGLMPAQARLGHALFVEDGLPQPHGGTFGVVVQIAFLGAAKDPRLLLGAVDPAGGCAQIDLRQESGLADGTVLQGRVLLMDGGAIGRSLVLQQLPGFAKVQGLGRQGDTGDAQDAGERRSIAHLTAP